MVAFDAGDGTSIYAEGFVAGAPPYTDHPRRWNGYSFVPAGNGWQGEAIDLRVLDDGTGSRLYSISVDAQNRRHMIRWPGAGGAWEPTPPGMYVNPFPDPGSYVYPLFSSATPGIAGLYGVMFDFPAGMIQAVRWNGAAWDILGGTGSGNNINTIGEFMTPTGPNLVVSGSFFDFSGIQAPGVVRWDGQQWHAMGQGESARAIVNWDDGTGTSLYIGFTGHSGNPPLSREGIARWDGASWVSVGGGLAQGASGSGGAWDITVFDDGTGPALFVLGRFSRAGGPNGIPARNIAKWDGQQWHALGAGVGGFPDHLAVADDGRGPSLFVEGGSSCGGGQVRNICQWVGCKGGRQCYADCDNNRQLNANDFICFINRFATNDPYANCDASAVSPAINAADFACFLNRFAAGCP